ncbi:MAG TPA: DUF4230 domain-containing protein [Acidimicrobiales bacterium]|nr:DUF4230 domain-containing protein [Acidimicrobiales bacterium]
MLRRSLVHVTVLCTALAAIGFGLVVGLKALRPSNPLQEQTVDRTSPALLKSLTDLAELHAAEGRYQVLVDLEKDTAYVPSVLKGSRVVYSATGSVDALVDLSAIGPGSVRVEGATVHVTVPAVRLADPALDLAESRVVSRERGLLDRFGSAVGDERNPDQQLMLLAQGKVGRAATEDAQLRQRAEANARGTIAALIRGLGFTDVVVDFEPLSAA